MNLFKNKKKKPIGLIIKIILRFLETILIFLFVLIIINQFDIKEVKSEYLEKSPEEIFGKPDYSKKNAYYRLFTLDEPEDVNVESDEVYWKYRKFLDPSYNKDQSGLTKAKLDPILKKINETSKKYPNILNLINPTLNDKTLWFKKVQKYKDEIPILKESMSTYLKRYRNIVNSVIFDDICNIDLYELDINREKKGSIPNYFALMRIGRIYNITLVLNIIDGNWESGIRSLIQHINTLKKIARTNKIWEMNLITKGLILNTISNLNSLINIREFPKKYLNQIIDMPDTKYELIENKKVFIERMVFDLSGRNFYNKSYLKFNKYRPHFPFSLFYQKNRTFKIYDDNLKHILYMDKTPPYLWKKDFKIYKNPTESFFWWVQNPLGKSWEIILNISEPTNKREISKNLEIKAMLDMLKIGAELKLLYNGEKDINRLLKTLKIYNSYIDLCSGTPYKWNGEKQVLYSIGIDRKDNKGDFNWHWEEKETDYPLPIILYVN